MSSDPKVEEIRARLEAATPGPWRDASDDWRPNWIVGQASTPEGGYYGTEDVLLIADDNLDGSYLSDEDAEFVAHAPTDIGYLLTKLDEVEQQSQLIAMQGRQATNALADTIERLAAAEGRERSLIAGVREALEGLEKYPMLDRSVTINSLSRLLPSTPTEEGKK